MPLSRRSLFALDFSGKPRAAGPWLRVHRTSMSCRFEVSLPAADGARVEAAEKALDEAERVEAMLATFRENSEVARLNRLPLNESVATSPDFFALLQYCGQLHLETGGAFDVTSAPLGRCRAVARHESRKPTASEIDSARALVGFDRIRLDAATGTVALSSAGTVVSFGAIGKGYAVDRMGQILRSRDVSQALVSAGGSSVLAIGGPDRGWPVEVQSGRPERPLRLCLRSGALGTSGSGEQFVLVNGRRHGGVLDPRTGQEPRDVRRATVVTADATTADALSTAFVVAGPGLARSYCDQHAGTLAVLTMNDPARTTKVFGGYSGAELLQRRDS
jgi:thiamine biosynthesis lipoprotein